MKLLIRKQDTMQMEKMLIVWKNGLEKNKKVHNQKRRKKKDNKWIFKMENI